MAMDSLLGLSLTVQSNGYLTISDPTPKNELRLVLAHIPLYLLLMREANGMLLGACRTIDMVA
jgi:hypothetical protein